MLRMVVGALVALILFSGTLLAADYTGKIKEIDHKLMTLTIEVNGKDMTFKFNDRTVAVDATDRRLESGLKAQRFKPGLDVTVTSQEKGPDLVATKVKSGK